MCVRVITRTTGSNLTLPAVGLLCYEYMGVPRNDPTMVEGTAHLMQNIPATSDKPNIYYWYYATQVLHNQPGPDWDTWNRKMRKLLIDTQCKDGCAMGSWDPRNDTWGTRGGRVMQTSLSALTLEVYYRYLPLYKLDKETPAAAPAAPARSRQAVKPIKPPRKKTSEPCVAWPHTPTVVEDEPSRMKMVRPLVTLLLAALVMPAAAVSLAQFAVAVPARLAVAGLRRHGHRVSQDARKEARGAAGDSGRLGPGDVEQLPRRRRRRLRRQGAGTIARRISALPGQVHQGEARAPGGRHGDGRLGRLSHQASPAIDPASQGRGEQGQGAIRELPGRRPFQPGRCAGEDQGAQKRFRAKLAELPPPAKTQAPRRTAAATRPPTCGSRRMRTCGKPSCNWP